MKRDNILLSLFLLWAVTANAQQSVKDLQLYAKSGDVPSMRMLGDRYLRGDGVAKNEQLGLKWLNDAADKGDKEAEKILAEYKKSKISTFLPNYKDEQVRSLAYDIENGKSPYDMPKGRQSAYSKMRDLALKGNDDAMAYLYAKKLLRPNDAVVLGELYEKGGEKGNERYGIAYMLYSRALNFANDASLDKDFKKRMCEGLFRLFDLGYGLGKFVDLAKAKAAAEKGDGAQSAYLGYYYYRMAALYNSCYDPNTVAKGAAECLKYCVLGAKQGNLKAMENFASLLNKFSKIEKCDWMGLGKALAEGTVTGTPVETLAKIPSGYPSLNEGYPNEVYKKKLNEYASELYFSYYRSAAIKGSVRGMLAVAQNYEEKVDYRMTGSSWYGTRNQNNYDMARQWFFKALQTGSRTALSRLTEMTKKRWERADEMKKEPDVQIVDTLIRIADVTVTAAIKPIEAAHALGDICYYITEINRRVNLGNNVEHDFSGSAWRYNLQVARSADRYDHRKLLRDAEFRLGKLRLKGVGSIPIVGTKDGTGNDGTPVVTSYDKAAVYWFDKALADGPDGSNDREVIYQRDVCRKNIEFEERGY